MKKNKDKEFSFGTRFFGHLKTVLIHKYWAAYYCFCIGIPVQGLLHDISKLSPTEFWEGVRYYTPGLSPIITCKKKKGYSDAWFHHKGRNKHHYEFWMDKFDDGGTNVMMPLKYALEMIADYLAAGKSYQKENFSFAAEFEWWKNRQKKPLSMHIALQQFVSDCLQFMYKNNRIITKKEAVAFYTKAINDYPDMFYPPVG